MSVCPVWALTLECPCLANFDFGILVHFYNAYRDLMKFEFKFDSI